MSYNARSLKAAEFIDDYEIKKSIAYAEAHKADGKLIESILEKGSNMKGISYCEAAILLLCGEEYSNDIFFLANKIKQKFYGNRVVLFAPLYLSNYCVNQCTYCPYHHSSTSIVRKKLSQEEIKEEVLALERMGHKRLAIEAGEDPVNCPIDYIVESIKTIYSLHSGNGAIRRVNVNIAATTTKNYKKLLDCGIGTYILFQETYNKARYERLHPAGPKANYSYHTEAMDRAMQAGIRDVGCGVLYGLSNYKYELVGQIMHANHLETVYNCGPHTVSVPRLRAAEGVDLASFKDAISDDIFYKIIAILRIALPYTGMIISTREPPLVRKKALQLGISQISGGSRTSVGGYNQETRPTDTEQFQVEDTRTLEEVIASLIEDSYIPSFCTACYREGRTGERFMSLLKSGNIVNCCHPNALLTLKEYLEDYASSRTKKMGDSLIEKELSCITNKVVLDKCREYLKKIESGERDFRF